MLGRSIRWMVSSRSTRASLKGAPLLAGMATLLQEQATRFEANERELLTQTAHDLERVSAVLAGTQHR